MLKAFEILGYGPASHGFVTSQHSKDNQMWEEGVELKWPGSSKFKKGVKGPPFGRREFDQLLGQYEIASDVPAICFAKELIEAYPEAKVIIVEREIESWFNSFQIAWPLYTRPIVYKIARKLDAQMDANLSLLHAITIGWFGAKNRKQLLANERIVYRKHYEEIREITPPERLLDFKLKDGWGPLCEFLGKDIPEGIEFPRVNDKGEYEKKAKIMGELMVQRILKMGPK